MLMDSTGINFEKFMLLEFKPEKNQIV